MDNININFHACILKRIRASNSAIQKFIATTKPDVAKRFMTGLWLCYIEARTLLITRAHLYTINYYITRESHACSHNLMQ